MAARVIARAVPIWLRAGAQDRRLAKAALFQDQQDSIFRKPETIKTAATWRVGGSQFRCYVAFLAGCGVTLGSPGVGSDG